jgi:hypothetical protein
MRCRLVSPLATKRSKEAYKLVGSEPGLAQDRAEDAALYVGASVIRDDYAYGGTIGMLQHVMAAGRMVDEKPARYNARISRVALTEGRSVMRSRVRRLAFR